MPRWCPAGRQSPPRRVPCDPVDGPSRRVCPPIREGALNRPKKPGGRHAARLHRDGITAHLSCSFNFLVIRDLAKSWPPARQRPQIAALAQTVRHKFPNQRNREFVRRNREFCLPKPKSSPDELFATHSHPIALRHQYFNLTKQRYNLLCTKPLLRHVHVSAKWPDQTRRMALERPAVREIFGASKPGFQAIRKISTIHPIRETPRESRLSSSLG
jgi:hypothetical protein